MFNECFSLVFDGCSRRKRLMAGLAAILTAAAAIGLESLSLENDLELMLPGDEQVRRSMRFLRESRFSDDVVVSLELKSPDRSPADLIRAAGQLEELLGPPLVTGVVSGVSSVDMVDGVLSLLEHVPELVDERLLSQVDGELTPEGVTRSLRRNYRQLVTPASTFMTPFVRSDPLGVSSGILGSLQELSSSLGYEVEIEDGHFISRDQAHAMLVVQTPITVTDASRARELILYLRDKLGDLPDYVSADIIAGHLHTISNEDVMKRDIWLTLGIAAAAFFFLFVFLFRDIRAAVLFLLPVASVLVAINLSNLLLSHLSYFIIGMGGVIAGISVDYGIHVYMAVRSGDGRADAVKRVAKPVVTGALTTVSVFAAFFFSSVQGYHQLALFSILSIGLCLASALFLLPHLMTGPRQAASRKARRGGGLHRFEGRGGFVVACWALVMIAAAVSMSRLNFDNDITQFDGSESYIIEAEQKFHRIWGGEEQPAVFVVPGRSLEGALRSNRAVYRDAMAVVGEEEFASLSAVWPLREERVANRARWREFWRQGREAKLKALLREHGPAYGFSDDAFSPFFDNLYAEGESEEDLEDLEIFSRLKERFVQERENGYQVLSFFRDEDRLVSQMSEVSARHPGTFLVSRKALSRALSRSVSSEIVYLSAVAALLVPLLAGLLLRSVRLTVLALVPVVTGVVSILGMIPILGLSLNAPSVISAMVAVGLCIDYGIFMVYHCHYRMETGTETAVTLSAVTTLIGAGVLLFARHPILFAIGLTMVTGVLAGYISSILVLPSLYRRLVPEGMRPG
jgi:predicted exporter